MEREKLVQVGRLHDLVQRTQCLGEWVFRTALGRCIWFLNSQISLGALDGTI